MLYVAGSFMHVFTRYPPFAETLYL
jgi:hypothetical protein